MVSMVKNICEDFLCAIYASDICRYLAATQSVCYIVCCNLFKDHETMQNHEMLTFLVISLISSVIPDSSIFIHMTKDFEIKVVQVWY